jgi:hypothetical protein
MDLRVLENKPGVVFDAGETTILFAEDVNELNERVGDTLAKRIVELKILDDSTELTTGDGKLQFCIPQELDGMNLILAHAFITTVSSSGTPTIQIRNVTDSADMLSTCITIDVSEKTSYTAAAQPVIDTAHDDVAVGDIIAIDVDVAGTGSKGLGVILTFKLP